MSQTTNTILMIRPRGIRVNEETGDNFFMKSTEGISEKQLEFRAQNEFDVFVRKLKESGVNIIIYDTEDDLDTPDRHFPNNWISFHEDGTVGLYPMYAKNRRGERRGSVLDLLECEGFLIKDIIDYTSAEDEDLFLEGTGSLVLDRVNRKAYCALSHRADEDLVIEFCEDFEYTPVIFSAKQTINNKREIIYHTNVMLCLGEDFAVICLSSIDDKKERKNVLKHLREDGKEIINISEAQVAYFAGNMLEVRGSKHKRLLIMSNEAKECLEPKQIQILEQKCEIISSSLKTIETCGGGSARCMMAEVFLPKA
jgi:hypothetical protein